MISTDLFIIFNADKLRTEDRSEYGIPQGPILNYIYGAWVGGRCILSSVVSEKYEKLFGVEIANVDGMLGPFNSEDELKKFGYLMADELEAECVYFLGLETFSNFVAESDNVHDLQRRLKVEGDIIVNMEKKDRADSVLSRFFNKNK